MESLARIFKVTKEGHFSLYLDNEFQCKQFWRGEAKHVHWEIRYQGAKYRPKIKAYWEELSQKGIQSDLYCTFQSKDIVDKFYDDKDDQ